MTTRHRPQAGQHRPEAPGPALALRSGRLAADHVQTGMLPGSPQVPNKEEMVLLEKVPARRRGCCGLRTGRRVAMPQVLSPQEPRHSPSVPAFQYQPASPKRGSETGPVSAIMEPCHLPASCDQEGKASMCPGVAWGAPALSHSLHTHQGPRLQTGEKHLGWREYAVVPFLHVTLWTTHAFSLHLRNETHTWTQGLQTPCSHTPRFRPPAQRG